MATIAATTAMASMKTIHVSWQPLMVRF